MQETIFFYEKSKSFEVRVSGREAKSAENSKRYFFSSKRKEKQKKMTDDDEVTIISHFRGYTGCSNKVGGHYFQSSLKLGEVK